MEALAIDYKNVDAFEQLIGGEMMKIDEGISFLITQSSFDQQLTSAVRVGVHPVFTVPRRGPFLRRFRAVHIHSPFTQGSDFSSAYSLFGL